MVIAYVMVFPSIVSYLCYNRGVELVGANRAGLFIHLMPVFGSLMAVVFLGEIFRWYHGLGIMLIGAGIYLATRR
jgi:drug/metabolite transporter (DMT)-like permease